MPEVNRNEKNITYSWQGLVVIFVLCIAFDWISYFLPEAIGMPIAYAHCALLLVVTVANFQLGLTFFLISIVIADDISRFLYQDLNTQELSNFMTVKIQSVTLVNYVAIGIVIIGIISSLKNRSDNLKSFRLNMTDYCVMCIAIVYAAASLHGYNNALNNIRVALHHLNMPVMLCAFYIVLRLHFSSTKQLQKLWMYFILAVSAKGIMWVLFAVTGVGSMFGGTIRVGFGIALLLLILPVSCGLILQQKNLSIRPIERITAIFTAVMAGEIILITAGRMTWIFTLYALVIIFALAWRYLNYRRVAAALICLIVLNLAVMRVAPMMFDTMGLMANSLNIFDADSVAGSHSTLVRIHEFKNIHAQLKDKDNLLLGEGPGGHFTDKYSPFPFQLREYDYPREQIITRKFIKPHGLLQRLMLNIGYGGMTVYLLCIFFVYLSCLLSYRCSENEIIRYIMLALLAFLPGIVYMTWSTKASMICGISFGIIGCICNIIDKSKDDGMVQSDNEIQDSQVTWL